MANLVPTTTNPNELGTVGTSHRKRLLRATVEKLRESLRFERVSVALFDPDRDVFVVRLFDNADPRSELGRGIEVARDEEGGIRTAFESGGPAIHRIPDRVPTGPTAKRFHREGFKTGVSVPIRVRGAVVGTLNLASKERIEPTETEVGLLTVVARLVGVALQITGDAEAPRDGDAEDDEAALEADRIIGGSPGLREAIRTAGVVAPTDLTVLITGETGTGKELLARLIHARSGRRDGPFVAVNCAALPVELVESELFGHEKGAFTGAVARKPGRFELADGGTIFLDEIGELSADVQPKLLRVLEERHFDSLGGKETLDVDVRVIAATNRDLPKAVAAGEFREDLYFRVNVFPIYSPPLRERREDIPLLVDHLVAKHARLASKAVPRVDARTLQKLAARDWPGNVRELENVIQRAVVLSRGSWLEIDEATFVPPPSPIAPPTSEPEPARLDRLEDVERRHIVEVLRRTNGIIAGPRGAARILGIHPNTLRSRMERLGLDARAAVDATSPDAIRAC